MPWYSQVAADTSYRICILVISLSSRSGNGDSCTRAQASSELTMVTPFKFGLRLRVRLATTCMGHLRRLSVQRQESAHSLGPVIQSGRIGPLACAVTHLVSSVRSGLVVADCLKLPFAGWDSHISSSYSQCSAARIEAHLRPKCAQIQDFASW